MPITSLTDGRLQVSITSTTDFAITSAECAELLRLLADMDATTPLNELIIRPMAFTTTVVRFECTARNGRVFKSRLNTATPVDRIAFPGGAAGDFWEVQELEPRRLVREWLFRAIRVYGVTDMTATWT